MKRNACPNKASLESYTIGVLSAGLATELELHLEECDACTEALTILESGTDDLLEKLRKLNELEVSNVLREPSYRSAVEAISRHEFSGKKRATAVAYSAKSQLDAESGATGQPIRRLGEYDLFEQIGRGGMGILYRGRHRRLCRDVAVKVLTRIDDPKAISRCHREMQAAGRVRHPNVVTTTDAGEIDGVLFLVMDLIDGLHVGQILARVRPMLIADACEIVRQACEGLEAISQQQLVHRDLKPGNLMVDCSGTVRILDLGLALIHDEQRSASTLTPVGMIMGSLDFMAPEQAEDTHLVDVRADIYSLGATLYTLLAGRSPLSGSNDEGRLEKFASLIIGNVTPLRTLRTDVPAELADIAGRMMARRPEDRFSTPQLVGKLLKPFCGGSDLKTLVLRAREASQPTEIPVEVRIPVEVPAILPDLQSGSIGPKSYADSNSGPETLKRRLGAMFRRWTGNE